MRVVIAGGHGKIALILERLLSQRGDTAVGLIRNPDHVADLEAAGAQPVVVDLEAATAADIAAHLQDADAVVFAAGAGPGSGAARKQTVDCDAAILLADAAEAAGVRRYVMVSAIGADVEAPDDIGDPVFVAYLRAKGAADDAIRARRHSTPPSCVPGISRTTQARDGWRYQTRPAAVTSPARTSPRYCSRCSTPRHRGSDVRGDLR